MKPEFRTPYNVKSLTLLLSLADGEDIADYRGKRYRLTIPVNALEYDNEPGSSALFYAVAHYQLGSASTPCPAGLTLTYRGNHVMEGSDQTDPRQAVIAQLVFDFDIARDAATFADIPLIVKGFHAATNAPAEFSLPAFTATPSPIIEATDKNGGAVGIGYEEKATGVAGGGDVIGPASSTDNNIALFNGATGQNIKDGGYTLAELQEAFIHSIVSSDGEVVVSDGDVVFNSI